MSTTELPEPLKPYAFHGLKLSAPKGDDVTTTCPLCGSEDKLSINIETSKFRCWGGACGEKGNSTIFLRKFWKLCFDNTRDSDYAELAKESGFTTVEGLRAFGVALSVTNGKWIIPGHNGKGEMTGLYKWTKIQNKKKEWVTKLLPTPGAGHHLFNLLSYDPAVNTIDIAEGWRDGIMWRDTLAESDHPEFNLLNRNVLAVPGTNSFKAAWCPFFSGKKVNILFDNDYPKQNPLTGEMKEPAGLAGVKYVASLLLSAEEPPAEVNFIGWGGGTNGYTANLPDGCDLRDFLRGE